jgi:hypothetical protein
MGRACGWRSGSVNEQVFYQPRIWLPQLSQDTDVVAQRPQYQARVDRIGLEVIPRRRPMSREAPPANFDRDFVEAVKRGWIHEDGDNSYITSKG